MDFSLLKKIVDEGVCKNIMFDGWGEPLLHPKITSMVNYVTANGISAELCTNAVLLTKKKALELLNAGIKRVKFSLDGMQETYEKIRGPYYEKVHANIKCFCSLKMSYHVKTEVSMVVNDLTLNEIPEFVKYWSKIVDSVQAQRQAFDDGKRTKPCTVLGRAFYVWWNGDVSPCCMDYDGHLVIGNLKKETIRNVVNGSKLRSLKKLHAAGKLPSFCMKCSEYEKGDLPYRLS